MVAFESCPMGPTIFHLWLPVADVGNRSEAAGGRSDNKRVAMLGLLLELIERIGLSIHGV
ncbi:hypothetical protein D3C77_204790 [compost metagenome]